MQSAILGNGLVLQNLLHMQMAQQQLLQIKDKQITNVSVCVCVFTCFNIPITKEKYHHSTLTSKIMYVLQQQSKLCFLQGYYWSALNPFVNNEKTAVFVQKGIIYIYLYIEVLEPYIQLAFLMQIWGSG